jgi:radical SAM protein with 4Fe4S-binding SPASM domain
MKRNNGHYINVLKWANAHKIRAITDYNIMARYDHSTDNLNHRLSVDETLNTINTIIENDEEYQKDIMALDFEEQEQKDRSNEIVCGVGISSLCMVANGNVYPCPGWQGFVLGNLKQEKLSDLWTNTAKIKYLRSLRKKDFPKCLNCENSGFCAMCMAYNANESPSGNPLEISDRFCRVTRLNRDMVIAWRQKLQ